MTQNLSDLTAQLLDAARAAGATSADAVAVEGTSINIDVRNGKLEQAERAEGIDIGLRVFVGQRSANVASSDARDATLTTMAQRAVAMAKEAPEDPYSGLASPDLLATNTDVSTLDLYDNSAEPDPAALEHAAREAEAAAMAVPGVTQLDSSSAGYTKRRVQLATSNGFSAGYQRTDHGMSCVAISGEGTGMERDYDYDSRIYATDMRSATDIGRIAGERAVARHGPRKPQTGTFPVLFDERIASSLIGHLLSAVSGTMIARGSSWARDLLDQPVLPDHLSLTENPHRPRASGSRLFDGEGLPTAPRHIVDNGRLTGWTLDLATARKLGLASTANAARGTSGPPSPSVTNIELTPGTATRDDLIADMGTGLLVTSMIGSTINPNTGDYSRGASGFWVENGQITHAVAECTVAGNLRDMLRRIVPANDGRPHLSRIVPSLLIDGLTLAGE